MSRSSSRSTRAHTFTARAYALVAIAPPAALIVFLVGSLILSGGQVSETTKVKWGAAVPYPLFVVPTTVLIVLSTASVVLAVVAAASARRDDVLGLRGLIGPTVAAAISAGGFAVLTPEHGVRLGDAIWGAQWKAMPISALALIILLIGIAVASRRRPIADAR